MRGEQKSQQNPSSLMTEERNLSQLSKSIFCRTITMQENIPTYMIELDELVKSMMEEGPNVISYGKGKKQKANV